MNCLVNYSASSEDEEEDSNEDAANAINEIVNVEEVSELKTNPNTSEHSSCFKFQGKKDTVVSQLVVNNNSGDNDNFFSSNSHQEAENCNNTKMKRIKLKVSSDADVTDNGNGSSLYSQFDQSNQNGSQCNIDEKKPLILPASIQCMFSQNVTRKWKDDAALHGNRKRSFAHVEGNWATHVYVPVTKDERLLHFVQRLMRMFSPVQFEMMGEFHLSLSRTVVVRHHWIDLLVDSLKQALSSHKSCVGDLDDIKLYTNDEKTRTFLCIEVSKDDTLFMDYVCAVDKCFKGFKLPEYYEDPSFHISVAWCLGDITTSVTEKTLRNAKQLLSSFCNAFPELSVVFARSVCCKTGNKLFQFPLVVV